MELSWEHWDGDPSEVEPVPKLKASYAFPLSAPSLLSVGQLSLPQPATEDPTQNVPGEKKGRQGNEGRRPVPGRES